MLRLSEVYTSVQGEGPNTGLMTQFVRFAGCNMRCPGWPCDTEFAINPELYLHDGTTENLAAMEVMSQIAEWPKRICLTGGEPFLQKRIDLDALTTKLYLEDYQVEVFTNGSFFFPEWVNTRSIRVMMDWKLTGSGEQHTKVLERTANAKQLKIMDGIKFVVTCLDDLVEAHDVYNELLAIGVKAQFWVGAAWGRIADQAVIDFVTQWKLPWRLNVQVHKHIWPPDERGV